MRASAIFLVAILGVYAGAVDLGASGTAPSGNRTPDFHGYNMFTVGAWWQEMGRDIRGDAVDPNSDHLISLMSGAGLHVDFSSSTANGGNSLYGIPINVVAGTEKLRPIVNGVYAGESDEGPAPLPLNSSVENYYDAGGNPPNSVPDGDHHLLVAVRNEATGGIDTLWELFQAYWDGVAWHAASTAKFDLASGAVRRNGWTSADAAGLPMLPLMVRYDEYAHGAIKHALRVTLNVGAIRNRYVWPARHAALSGSMTDGIPFGARLRLKDSWYQAHKAQYAGEARAILDALAVYGMINADIGGMLFLSGVSDERFSKNTLLTLQAGVPGTALEVMRLLPGYSVSGPTCIALGQTATYTVSHYPSTDTNFDNHHYVYEDGGNQANFPGDYGLHLTPLHPTATFQYRPVALGAHMLTVDQSGEYMLEPGPYNVTVRTTCPAL